VVALNIADDTDLDFNKRGTGEIDNNFGLFEHLSVPAICFAPRPVTDTDRAVPSGTISIGCDNSPTGRTYQLTQTRIIFTR